MLVCQVGSQSLSLRQTLQKQQTSGETRSATLIAKCSLDFRSYLFSSLLRLVCGDAGGCAHHAGVEECAVALMPSGPSCRRSTRSMLGCGRRSQPEAGEVFAEHFDFARFPAEQHAGGLVDLLRNRYGTRKLDMVITTGYEALQFALSKRSELLPGVPITFCGIERHQLAGQTLPPDVTGAVLFYDFRRTSHSP